MLPVKYITVNDLQPVVRLLSDVAAITAGKTSRRRTLLSGLSQLIKADSWSWLLVQFYESENGEDPEFELLDIEQSSDNEQVRRKFALQGHHPVVRMADFDDDDLKSCRTFAVDHALLSRYPLPNRVASILAFHRNAHQPKFNTGETALIHLVASQVVWIHDTELQVSYDEYPALSPRQRTVLRMLLNGDSRKAIASKLRLSEHTINDYIKILHRQFKVRSRAQLLACFINGALSLPEVGVTPDGNALD